MSELKKVAIELNDEETRRMLPRGSIKEANNFVNAVAEDVKAIFDDLLRVALC